MKLDPRFVTRIMVSIFFWFNCTFRPLSFQKLWLWTPN